MPFHLEWTPGEKQLLGLTDAQLLELDQQVAADRERRWRMCQLGCNLLEDFYPQGIDKGPSYRQKTPSSVRIKVKHRPPKEVIVEDYY